MARIEKTVFISYRRKDIGWALAVYQYLTSQKYDVFFDYTSISSGDFEEIILSNIKARAHFLVILTPSALDRCSEPGDWIRREIETAIHEKRNIIPLFFDSFSFSLPSLAEKLTGELSTLQRYNGLEVPAGYFLEAMGRLRSQYLNVPLDAVLCPVSDEVQRIVHEQQLAANTAIAQRKAPARRLNRTWITFGAIGIAVLASLIFAVNYLVRNTAAREIPTATMGSATATVTFILTTTTPNETEIPPTAETPMTLTPVPSLGIGSTMISPKDGMVMVYVPAGGFQMGSAIGKDDQKPVHNVFLDAFWIDQTEVTNAMYTKCVDDGQCLSPAYGASITGRKYWLNPEFNNYPVIYVSWDDAQSYCVWANRRLPTEAEWEKAARGIDGNLYPWGNTAPNNILLNYNGSVGDTTAVNMHPKGKSIYGALDLAGNVWEWVYDLYDSSYYRYSPLSNPAGPSTGQARVLRGGSWYSNDLNVRSALRYWEIPTSSNDRLGFRCARSE